MYGITDSYSAFFYSASTLSGVFAGLIAYGVQKGLEGADGWPSWKFLFIIEGVAAIALGLLMAVLLPGFPDRIKKSWIFSDAEMQVARARSEGKSYSLRAENMCWTERVSAKQVSTQAVPPSSAGRCGLACQIQRHGSSLCSPAQILQSWPRLVHSFRQLSRNLGSARSKPSSSRSFRMDALLSQ